MPPTVREIVRSAAIHIPSPVLSLVRYPRESLFVNGYADFKKQQSSILFFTTHKCASMLMTRILRHINRRVLGLTPLNLAAYCWDTASGESVHAHLSRHSQQYFRDRGILYAPLRSYIDIAHLQQSRVLLMLRDPRDVVVSGYFSAKYSHRPPASAQRRKAFLAHREWLAQTSLEDYVLEFAPPMVERYTAYRQNISRDALLTYEHMWWDFNAFTDRLEIILGVEFSDSLRREIAAIASMGKPVGEDVTAHQRKGIPGDYKEKLSPDVAARITELFADSLAWMYDESAQ